jgi:RimJ/RimL family protein N-acetyltransferase
MHLTTPRLMLRRFRPDDLELLVRLHADPKVMRYVGGTKDRAQTEELLAIRILDYYDQHPGLGIWATLERSTGDCCGMHLLNHVQGEPLIQVGYLLFPQFWGLGYATEMATAVVRYGFAQLGLPRIHGLTDLDNYASQHVLEKTGLHRHGERTFPHPAYEGHGPFAFFERSATEWLTEQPEKDEV